MARITVEDCLVNQSNRFSLVRLAARRAKQLLSGSSPVADTKGNRAIVSALREIAGGKVRFRSEETSPAEEFSDPLLKEINLAALEAASASSTVAASPSAAAAEAPAEAAKSEESSAETEDSIPEAETEESVAEEEK